jgi:putative glutamine amidotransferase
MVGEKYITAVTDAAHGTPVLIPALDDRLDLDALLRTLDGVMLTGSTSDIEPHHYTDEPGYPDAKRDSHRDRLTLPLARRLVDDGIPLFAICRGFQELNVSLGGTLHQKLAGVAGMLAHKERAEDPLDVQYGPSHAVDVVPGGMLARITGKESLIVNSLHGQGVRDLAPGLVVEATASDGLVEAYRVERARGFTLAVQWHPEWRVMENPDSVAIFEAFGEACRVRQAGRG